MNTKDCYGLWESFHQIIVQNYIKTNKTSRNGQSKTKKTLQTKHEYKKSSLQKLKWLYHLKQTGPISKPKA